MTFSYFRLKLKENVGRLLGGGGGGGGGGQRICWLPPPPPSKIIGGSGPPLPTPMHCYTNDALNNAALNLLWNKV